MKQFSLRFGIILFTTLLLSSCFSQDKSDTNLSWDSNNRNGSIDKIGQLLKKSLDNPATKTIAERMYTDYSAGFINEDFFYTSLVYLNDKPSLPPFLENYKKNMGIFGEKSSDTASDYIGGYIFAYAGVSPDECTQYTNALSGTFVGKRVLYGCVDVTLLYNVLKDKNEKLINSIKQSGLLKINEDFFRSLAQRNTKDCGSCSIIVDGINREKAFEEIRKIEKADLKNKPVTTNLKEFNILALTGRVKPDFTDREKFDLIYDNFTSYHAIYAGDPSICTNIKDSIIASTCTKYMNNESAQKQEYANYIEPYIIYSYLYEL